MTTVVLKNHPYHKKTDEELRYIIKDAREAANNAAGFDYATECKYLDQINDAITILNYRKSI